MYPAGNLIIPAPHGRIEGILKEPPVGKAGPRGTALVLHPHPLFQGTMHNKVVFRAARALNDAGLVALRINFRGVGSSTGEHSGARGGEQEDARIALEYLSERYPDLPSVIAGFSFGSRVGLEVGTYDPRVGHLIGIGTPVSLKERDYDFTFLRDCRKPLLLVHGDRDEFGTVDDLMSLRNEIGPQVDVQVEIISGAGHFFDSQLDELQRIIRIWIDSHLTRSL